MEIINYRPQSALLKANVINGLILLPKIAEQSNVRMDNFMISKYLI